MCVLFVFMRVYNNAYLCVSVCIHMCQFVLYMRTCMICTTVANCLSTRACTQERQIVLGSKSF